MLPALCLGLGSGLAPRPCSREGDQLCDNTLGGQPCLGAILKRAPKRAPLLCPGVLCLNRHPQMLLGLTQPPAEPKLMPKCP